MKEMTMTINQFLDYERGTKTLRYIKSENEVENLLDKIVKNERLNKMLVFTIAALNYAAKVSADVLEATDKIDIAGFKFLGLAQKLGYWLCLIFCIIEILKSLMNGSSKDIAKIAMKYILIFASLYLLPFAFDMIKEIFG